MRTSGTLDDGTGSAGDRTVSLRIFLNYRREDASGHAGHLFDELADLEKYDIFMDIEKIEPGLPFKEAIDRALTSCDVFLALIGRQWLDVRDSSGSPRLDNPNDFVRLEIAAALAQESVRVVPILIQKTEMPASEELPEPLHRLTERHALELSDTRWQYDVEQLVRVLDTIAASKAEANARWVEDERARREREAAGAAGREAQNREHARKQEEERKRRDRDAAERERAEGAAAERAGRDRGGGGLSRRVKLLLAGVVGAGLVALAVGLAATFLADGDGGGDVDEAQAETLSANRGYVRTIDGMLIDSARTRSDLGSLVGRVDNLSIPAAQAKAEIDAITEQRRSLLTAVSNVSVPPAFGRSATLLRRSLVASIEADQAIDSWIDAKFARNKKDVDYFWSRNVELSRGAGNAKDAFLEEYNAKRLALLDKPPLDVRY